MANQVSAEARLREVRSNEYASGLIDRIAACQTDDEIVTLSKQSEKAVMRLKDVNPARFHHVVNLIQLMRRDFERARKAENKRQQEMW